MKLSDAVLCLDCDSVYAVKQMLYSPRAESFQQRNPCPHCGSRSGWPLKNWVQPVHGVSVNDLAGAERRQ